MTKPISNPTGVKTRFAPSPTGFLHIGSVRTALFNYLFAKSQKGIFVLRIEDTDKERSKKEYETDILESLKWLGIDWDEKPYHQSERLPIFAKYLQKLLDENKAYYCFCSEEDLEAQRQYQMSIGEAPRYSGKCANLSEKEVEKLIRERKPSVIRFRITPKKVKFHDLIRGNVEFDAALFGDVVIAKDLNAPLYNFSVVIDDYEMKISHVIRGEEHLSNTPRQILILEALNLPVPEYAHLPLILAPDRTKLSKRHGAVSANEYKKDGYLPEAIVNFIAFLGWNPGGEREIYSMNSLIKEFSLDRIQKAGAIFNTKRLEFINGFYIRQRSTAKIAELCLPYLIEAGIVAPSFRDTDKLQKVVSLYQGRLKKISEITELVDFFFKDIQYDKNLLKWKQMQDFEVKDSLLALEKIFDKIKPSDWTKENLEKEIMPLAEKMGPTPQVRDRGYLLWPFRVALTGKMASAGPFEVAALLEKEKSLQRIKDAIEKLES